MESSSIPAPLLAFLRFLTNGPFGSCGHPKNAFRPHAEHLLHAAASNKKTLVLDLDETLIRSFDNPIPNPDFVVPVGDGGELLYVLKRPGLDEFLVAVKDLFEVVVFTASSADYANPIIDVLDTHHAVNARLFRESCTLVNGAFVKNLNRLGRNLGQVLIVDNSPSAYQLQPQNALPVSSFVGDPNDRELVSLIPLLRRIAASNVAAPLFLRQHRASNRGTECIKTRDHSPVSNQLHI